MTMAKTKEINGITYLDDGREGFYIMANGEVVLVTNPVSGVELDSATRRERSIKYYDIKTLDFKTLQEQVSNASEMFYLGEVIE